VIELELAKETSVAPIVSGAKDGACDDGGGKLVVCIDVFPEKIVRYQHIVIDKD
jgi:hypothetical protein